MGLTKDKTPYQVDLDEAVDRYADLVYRIAISYRTNRFAPPSQTPVQIFFLPQYLPLFYSTYL